MKARAWMIAAALLVAAQAQAAGLKIAYVDVRAAIENTKEYQAGIERLKALQAKRQKELDALRRQIEAKQEELDKKAMVLSPEKLSRLEEELKDLRKQFERRREDAQEELREKKMRLDMRMMKRFREVLEAYAKEHGYDFVFGRPVLLYAAPSHEITAEITKRLDAAK